ncbi:Kinesin-like protein kin-5c [Thalictrum thalictroides]|uniref:Kinesin-like protein kin-5c n=1 Tax=Thalictrum thalictroides TaxID=46969 RepID=A0A7J6X3K2_THATH|nr:Kinesin-like protein kin-5c [Thalictrum thalictroides]
MHSLIPSPLSLFLEDLFPQALHASEFVSTENALAHQACVLQSDLEKSHKDNASLFSKLAREDKLNSENRSVVDDFQASLSQKIGTLCSTVATSMSEQHGHLECVNKLCQSFLEIHEKLVSDLKKKMAASKALFTSHMEAMQNVVHLHKASNNAGLGEISSLALANASAHLATMDGEASSIFADLQAMLSSQQGEMALFVRELREKFHKNIAKFHKSYEEQNPNQKNYVLIYLVWFLFTLIVKRTG